MAPSSLKPGQKIIIGKQELDGIIQALQREKYTVVGPVLGDGAIVYDQIHSVQDLPEGWTDDQEAGTYRLKKRQDQALFGYAVGPHSWKKFLDPPNQRLWSATRAGSQLQIEAENHSPPRYAFLGVRSCELHAIAIQDKVFLGGDYAQPHYQKARDGAFLIAVQCGQSGGTCFCVSMKTGPKAEKGFDLALTEILESGRHEFLIEIGTERGAAICGLISSHPAQAEDEKQADRIVEQTARQMGRVMETRDIKELLYRNYENARWEEVAQRCLSCANCTMVCPTCFCSTVEDVTDLRGEHAERWKKWDSCFTLDFSYIHGGPVRTSTRSRYRQWMTHKLATWIDQFGSSGCVGCGRCITWCPVGIDITEEARAIRTSETKEKSHGKEKL